MAWKRTRSGTFDLELLLSESEDSEEYDNVPKATLDSIVKSETINFPIRANYTNWKPREAFRELLQNW
jgi:hypothetical protein